MQKGLVTVVIPNFNYAHYVGEALDSVLSQTYPSLEIIVVDDGSTDNSKEVLESYGDKINAVYQQNQGVSVARNNGAAAGKGEFIAFIDADDAWMPEKIEKQIARFEIEPEIGLVHVGVAEVDAEGRTLLERLEGSEDTAVEDLLMLGRKGILGGGSGLMIRREVFYEIGGFDERLSTSADWDLFYQAASRYPIGFVPEILIRYRIHNSNMHGNVKVMEHDMLLALDKIFPDTTSDESRVRYGDLYKTLAGSYFKAGDYAAFVRTAAQSLKYQPRNLSYFAGYPFRKIRSTDGGVADGTSR